MEEDIRKKPLNEIITEMTRLEQEIDILLLKYEKLRLEVIRRYPVKEIKETFKPKIKRK